MGRIIPVAETDNPYPNYVSVRVLNCMGEMFPIRFLGGVGWDTIFDFVAMRGLIKYFA